MNGKHHLTKRFMVQVWEVRLMERATGRQRVHQVVSDWLVGAVRTVDRDLPGWTVISATMLREPLMAQRLPL